MSHGRTFYKCGCLRVQCRCPGPHTDTVLPVECLKHRQERAAFEQRIEAALALPNPWFERALLARDRERLIDERRD